MFQLGKKPKKAEETEHPSLFEISYHFLPVSLFFMLICIYFILKYKILPADNISGLSSVFSEKDFATVVRCLKLGVAKICVMTPGAFESLG